MTPGRTPAALVLHGPCTRSADNGGRRSSRIALEFRARTETDFAGLVLGCTQMLRYSRGMGKIAREFPANEDTFFYNAAVYRVSRQNATNSGICFFLNFLLMLFQFACT